MAGILSRMLRRVAFFENSFHSFIQRMLIKHGVCFKPHFSAGYMQVKEAWSVLLEYLERSMLLEAGVEDRGKVEGVGEGTNMI